MDFGITLKSDMDWKRELKLAQQAEAGGFRYVWSFDSHVLWQSVFPRFALWANATKKVRIGTLVTNPVVRDVTVAASDFATLQKITTRAKKHEAFNLTITPKPTYFANGRAVHNLKDIDIIYGAYQY